MTLSEYQYAGRKWVLTTRPFQEKDGKLVTGLRIPGIPPEDMAPGIIFSLTESDLDRIDFGQWIRKGRVLPYVEPPKPKPKPAPTRGRRSSTPEPEDEPDGDVSDG